MRKLFLILLAILPFCSNSQSLYDVYNISTSYYQGTAKSMAMGNAMGAVGQDFSALSINPAGLGLFRKPTFTFTPSIITSYTKSQLNGNKAIDSKAKLSVNNFGYVGTNETGENIITWAVGMNRTNNYNNSIYIDGYNDNTSLVDAYFLEIMDNGITNDEDLRLYSPSYIYPLWQTYIINFEQDGLYTPIPLGTIRQQKGVNSWGGTNEWTISTSINFKDKIFFGVSINLPYVYSRRYTEYKEDWTYNNRAESWLQEETLSTTGWGVNGKIGLIAFPAKWLRLGAAFHTPTAYELTDTWKTQTLSHIEGIDYQYFAETQYFHYSMMTPMRANASAAFIFGNFGMITADCEYVDYGTMRLSSFDYDYNDYNDIISETFKPTMNLRLGTEWRYKNMCFRGGYSLYGSPYGIKENDYCRNALSCGIGYTQRLLTIDIAYVFATQKHQYNLYSQYTNYYTELPDNNVIERNDFHNIVVSLKLRLY